MPGSISVSHLCTLQMSSDNDGNNSGLENYYIAAAYIVEADTGKSNAKKCNVGGNGMQLAHDTSC